MRLIPNHEPVDQPASAADHTEESGFLENWNAALGLAISEDLPIVSRMVPTEVESSQKKLIRDYIESGDIPYSVAMFYGDDFNGLRGYGKTKLGLEGLYTDEDYREARNQEYRTMREYSHSVFERSSGMGLVGQIAGQAHAMMLDPVYAVSTLTGYGMAATIGKAFLMTAAIEAGVETVAQIPKMSFKEEIDSEYSGAQALTEIAFAGLGAGTIAALGKGASKLAGKMFGPEDLTVGDAIHVFENMAKNAPEVEPILNTLRHADPSENLSKVLEADEAIDIQRVNESPLRRDAKANSGLKSEDFLKQEEEIFLKRQPVKPEGGVPRGTLSEADKEAIRALDAMADADLDKLVAALPKRKTPSRSTPEKGAAPKQTREEMLAAMRDFFKEDAPKKKKGGVPRGTPTEKAVAPEPDLRHPLVVGADSAVAQVDDTIRIMEECF